MTLSLGHRENEFMILPFLISLLSLFANAQQYPPGSVAVLDTSYGEIRIHLRLDLAPLTARHFINLAEGRTEYRDPDSGKTIQNRPFYQNQIFHRVHPDLGIHTGCPWGTGHGWPGFYIPFEKQLDSVKFDRPYVVGFSTIPRRPESGGSQFFITTKPAPELNGKYVIFGEVFLGKEVVDQIARAKTDSMMRPLKSIRLNRITIE